MGDKSQIEWTDATWPVVVGCEMVSPGCANCYAVKDARRMGGNPNAKVAAVYGGLVEPQSNGVLGWTGVVRCIEERLDWPLRWTKPRRIFTTSQADLFHEKVPQDFLDRVFAVMAMAQQHTFQILTKRPERMRAYLSDGATPGRIWEARRWLIVERGLLKYSATQVEGPWPLPNVWVGTSVEDQTRAELRIPQLLLAPAAVRFLSCEPLLGPVDLLNLRAKNGARIDCLNGDVKTPDGSEVYAACPGSVTWVIAGGESGTSARPMHPDWARSLRDQCRAAGVAYLFKQWGEYAPLGHYQSGWAGPVTGRQLRFPVTYVSPDGQRHTAEYDLTNGMPTATAPVIRLGKKDAGRTLDGRTWDQFPTADGRVQREAVPA
jgi:protein gp37